MTGLEGGAIWHMLLLIACKGGTWEVCGKPGAAMCSLLSWLSLKACQPWRTSLPEHSHRQVWLFAALCCEPLHV